MSEAADVQAEIVELARFLSRDPEELAFLADAPPADLRPPREQVTDSLFHTHGTRPAGVRPPARCCPSA